MKSFKFHPITLAIALYSTSLSIAFADIQSATSDTSVSRKREVEIINIARPNQDGLSHNKYNKFNVDKSGAVLNNALKAGNSELAGKLERNPNLQNKTANIILNEVVSNQPSKLKGKQEVFGQKADYVLANPNGISCDGCGFINTPRASLVVGRPDIKQDKITYTVDSQNTLTTQGKVTNKGLEQLDLIAPKIEIGGEVSGAESINIVTGHNKVALGAKGTTQIQVLPQKNVVLDGAIVGSMYAGKIRIHSSNEQGTLTIQAADLQSKELAITAGNIDIKGKVTKTHNYSNYDRTDKKRVRSVGYVDSSKQSYAKSQLHSDNIVLSAQNNLAISGASLQGKNTTIIGNNVNFGTQTTTKVENKVHNQSKGSWFRKESDFKTEQTLHRTTIASESVKIVADSGKVVGKALKIDTNNLGIYGENGVQFNGDVTTNRYAALSNFKRETWRLKTGNSRQDATVQNYTASEFNVKNQAVLGSNGSISLSGNKLNVDGDLSVKANKVAFLTDQIQHTYNINDHHKFWGGLAGAKTVGLARNENIRYGADITVKNNLRIESENGTKVVGSRVITQGDGYVIAKKGGLLIDSAYSSLTKEQSLRKGGAFNITKLREQHYEHSSLANRSEISSDSNLYLSTDKQLSINGSQISAAGLLDISALSGIKVTGATNSHVSHSNKTTLSFTGNVDPKVDIDLNYKSAAMMLFKSAIKNDPIKNMVEGIKSKTQASIKADVSLNIQNAKEDRYETTHTSAKLTGGNTNINTSHLLVAGSQISAEKGDLNINANRIDAVAQHNQVTSDKKATNVKVGVTVTADKNEVSAQVGVTANHTSTHANSLEAKGSQFVAKNDINLTASTIKHQGTTLSSGGKVVQTGNQINNLSAQNTHTETTTTANAGLSVSAGVNKSKVLNVNVALNADGGKANSHTTNHLVTTINAGTDIISHSNQLTDQGTSYTANNNVSLSSTNHQLSGITNGSSKNSITAGANVNMSASTTDMNSVNLKVSVGGKFQKEDDNTSNQQGAAISGKNVNIQTGKLNSQANISATENLNITAAESAKFTHINKNSSSQGGGFNASVGVGALVIPAANAAIPSIDVNVGVNGHSSNSSVGTEHHLNGKNVSITSHHIDMQGTNINASNNATLTADSISMSAVKNSENNLSGSASLGINVGTAAANSGFNANFKVAVGNQVQHQGTNTNGKNVVLSANNASLNGVSVHAENATLNVANLALNANQNTKKQTDVGLGLSLSGNGAGNQWLPNAGSANVDVNVIRNEVHSGSSIKADNVNIQSDNTTLVGSTITTTNASGNINRLTEHSVVDKINEVNIGLSASGSGKITPYTKENFKDKVKGDFKNGTIAGVKADVKVKFGVNIQKSNAKVGVSSANNKLGIRHHVHQGTKVKYIHKKLKVDASANTNLKAAREAIKNKQIPLVKLKIER